MNPLYVFLANPLRVFLIAFRIAVWILVTGAFWAIVLRLPTHPLVADLTAILVFFICYAVTPRIQFMERLLRRVGPPVSAEDPTVHRS
jgi:hypothetical protein